MVQHPKTAIVTGANDGMGFVTALQLAQKGYAVGLVCRNKTKGERAVKDIVVQSGNSQVYLFIADMSECEQVRNVAAQITQAFPKLCVLVNNVGVFLDKRQTTSEGIEKTLATNHIGAFILTNLLLDPLKASGNARIVNVASQAQMAANIHWDDIGLTNDYSGFTAYSNSKLMNIMFTISLAERLSKDNISVNAVHPGGVATNFAQNSGGIVGSLFKYFGFLLRSPEKGAQTTVWLASSPDVQGISGSFWCDKRQIKAQALAYQVQEREMLWNISNQLAHSEFK